MAGRRIGIILSVCPARKESDYDIGGEVLKSMTIDMRFEKREKLIREEERAAGYESGIQKGIEQGTLNTLIDLVKSENLNIEIAAEKAGMTVPDFVNLCNSCFGFILCHDID